MTERERERGRYDLNGKEGTWAGLSREMGSCESE